MDEQNLKHAATLFALSVWATATRSGRQWPTRAEAECLAECLMQNYQHVRDGLTTPSWEDWLEYLRDEFAQAKTELTLRVINGDTILES